MQATYSSQAHRITRFLSALPRAAAITLAGFCATLTSPATAVPPIDPFPICQLVTNGNFNQTLCTTEPVCYPLWWQLTTDTGGYGDFNANAWGRVVNIGGAYGNVAELTSFSTATHDNDWPAGSAGSAKVVLAQEIENIPHTFIRLDVAGGGFGATLYDQSIAGYSVSLIVHNLTNNARYQRQIAGSRYGGTGIGCHGGLALIGIFPERRNLCFNLGPAGFSQGDDIRIEIVFQTYAVTTGPCDDFSEFSSTIRLDNVRICNGCRLTHQESDPEGMLSVEVVSIPLDD